MRRADTREELLVASGDLFAERGIPGTTMRAIAEVRGIQAASLYHHFASKEELVAAIMVRSSDHVVGLYDEIRAAELPPVARLEALVRATLANFALHPAAAQMFYDNPAYVATAPLLQSVRDDASANDRLWVDTIDEACAAGRVRPELHVGRLKVLLRNMMWSTTRGLSRHGTGVDASDDVVALLLHGCLVPPRTTRERER